MLFGLSNGRHHKDITSVLSCSQTGRQEKLLTRQPHFCGFQVRQWEVADLPSGRSAQSLSSMHTLSEEKIKTLRNDGISGSAKNYQDMDGIKDLSINRTGTQLAYHLDGLHLSANCQSSLLNYWQLRKSPLWEFASVWVQPIDIAKNPGGIGCLRGNLWNLLWAPIFPDLKCSSELKPIQFINSLDERL